jgi:ABC-2 type transport system permease protein
MNIATIFDCAGLIFKADFLTTIRYRNAMVGTVIGVLFQVATYYYLSRAIGPGFRPDGVPAFAFLLIGIGISGYLHSATYSFVRSVREAQSSGTFEILMSSSTPGTLVLMLMGISSSLAQLLELGLYMFFGLALSGFRLDQANIAGALAIFALSLLVTVAIGLLCASVQIATQKSDSVVSWLGASAALAGGALFPISVLPGWLQSIARLNPLLYCLDGLRAALYKNASFSELSMPLLALGVGGLIALPLSLFLLEFTLRRARRSGSLGFY